MSKPLVLTWQPNVGDFYKANWMACQSMHSFVCFNLSFEILLKFVPWCDFFMCIRYVFILHVQAKFHFSTVPIPNYLQKNERWSNCALIREIYH